MKNYKDSDYSLNKYSEGIVYRFSDGSRLTVSLTDYLSENPSKTRDDFQRLKALSDSDYLERDRSHYRQSWKDTPFDELSETILFSAQSPESELIEALEEKECKLKRAELAKKALDKLTEIQRKRYRMYHVDGLSIREIAECKRTHFTAVHESLQAAEKKIKKIISAG